MDHAPHSGDLNASKRHEKGNFLATSSRPWTPFGMFLITAQTATQSAVNGKAFLSCWGGTAACSRRGRAGDSNNIAGISKTGPLTTRTPGATAYGCGPRRSQLALCKRHDTGQTMMNDSLSTNGDGTAPTTTAPSSLEAVAAAEVEVDSTRDRLGCS